jgi:integrase
MTRTTWLSLRHWYGTELAENGVPLKTLQEQMGHASIATTMRHYVHAKRNRAAKLRA